MIKLDKGPKPASLEANDTAWRDELLGYLERGEQVPENLKRRYNNSDVKNALRTECNEKCMYCESKVNHVAYEHIEHYKPKDPNKYPELTFEWSNLGLACPVCNQNKSNVFDEDVPFVNPYTEQPEDFFQVIGPFIWGRAGNAKGRLTELQIKLNRAALVEHRKQNMDRLRSLYSEYVTETNALVKRTIMDVLMEMTEHYNEHSFCLRHVLDGLESD